MIIAMVKQTNIAYAPDEICKAINKHTDHTCFVTGDMKEVKDADVVHYHNKYLKCQNGKQVIQFHSEPERVNLSCPCKKLVIAQYHATLPEYRKCSVVRNIINLDTGIYTQPLFHPPKLKIGYSPSTTVKQSDWFDKGYAQTKEILERAKKELSIDYDIICGVSLEESLRRKASCSVVIDECVTKSYHRSALEGLALGKMTICSIGDDVQEIVKKSCGDYLPVENINIDSLYDFLTNISRKPITKVNNKGKDNRQWMETYWNPKDIVNEYIKIYEELK